LAGQDSIRSTRIPSCLAGVCAVSYANLHANQPFKFVTLPNQGWRKHGERLRAIGYDCRQIQFLWFSSDGPNHQPE
jgi:hypothetical protein